MDEVPIPVDIHIARATLGTGVLTGKIKNIRMALDFYNRIIKLGVKSYAGIAKRIF